MDLLLTQLPPELRALPVLLAGFLALLGLVLWSAGVKAARPLAAGTLGAALAALAAWLLPTFTGLGQLPSSLIGLAVGLIIGATAFRALQGILLASCLGLAAAGAFYHWQIAHQPPQKNQLHAIALPALPPLPQAPSALPEFARQTLQTGTDQWQTIPSSLRQCMIVIAAAVAILALAITWILPRYTTWLTTAAGGAALVLLGGLALLRLYGPQYEQLIPGAPQTRMVALALFVLAGMLVQRLLFWPGKHNATQAAAA
jgi:hypothetical protein